MKKRLLFTRYFRLLKEQKPTKLKSFVRSYQKKGYTQLLGLIAPSGTTQSFVYMLFNKK